MSSATGLEPDDDAVVAGPSLRGRIGRVAAASAIALVFGEVLTLVQTIALARLLTPAEVGIFVSGTVITSFLGEFVEGGLRAGLVQRGGDITDAAETVFWATLGGGVVMSLGALAAAPVVGIVFDSSTAAMIAAITSGTLVIFSVTNVPESMLQRAFSVRRRLVVGPSVAVAYAVVAVSLAAAGLGVWSLVVGMYASFITWAITIWLITDWRPGRGKASRTLWRELARYGLPLVLGGIGARVQNAMETVVVGRGLTQSALGNFRYGQRISQMPVRAIIEIGAVSLFPAFSQMAGDRMRLRAAYLRALRWVIVGAAALSGLMVALGSPAVTVVFGEPWHPAGVAVSLMAGLGVGKALISVGEEVIKACDRTALLNWYTAAEVLLGIGTLVLLVSAFELDGAALSLSITAVVVGLVVTGLAIPLVEVGWGDVARAVLPPVPAAVIATVVTWVLDRHVLTSADRALLPALGCLVVAGLVFGVVYLIALAVTAPSSARSLLRAATMVASRLTQRRTGADVDMLSGDGDGGAFPD
ncbi:oligosaccharide flippase family protein [Williamsia deligens]|uniref:Oligosaccharide flippase family protein n=1 Tax=Williamsia deligens TaxID=321325 RepID=A0ABW3G495_9NOCA|nr:oligosaccharide flippase family protein [Williamsia deligens]MCP2194177.1 polysaccharide transporter, PST family [Williamsia deligens]